MCIGTEVQWYRGTDKQRDSGTHTSIPNTPVRCPSSALHASPMFWPSPAPPQCKTLWSQGQATGLKDLCLVISWWCAVDSLTRIKALMI